MSLRDKQVYHNRSRITTKRSPQAVQWNLARITDLNRSSDGKLRPVSMKMADNWTMSRPINLIILLEIIEGIDNSVGQK